MAPLNGSWAMPLALMLIIEFMGCIDSFQPMQKVRYDANRPAAPFHRHSRAHQSGVLNMSEQPSEDVRETDSQIDSVAILSQTKEDGETRKWLDSEKSACEGVLAKLDFLEQDAAAGESASEEQREQLRRIESSVDILDSVPIPDGTSMKEYKAVIRLLLQLPPYARMALVKALDMEEGIAGDVTQVPNIADRLIKDQTSLTPYTIQKARDDVKKGLTRKGGFNAMIQSGEQTPEEIIEEMMKDLLGNKTAEESRIEKSIESMINRAARKDTMRPSEEDLDILVNALKNDTSFFSMSSKPISIPGGFLIRGSNRKSNGNELIEALDAILPAPDRWNGTVSWMLDVANDDAAEEMFSKSNNALVLFHKDMSPITSPWLYRLTSAAGVTGAFLFAVGVYGSNDAVINQLTDALSLSGGGANDGTVAAVDWFNGKIADVLLPIAAIATAHELGHFAMGKKNGISTASTLPVILPCWGSLPFVGTLTRIASSPKNLNDLFDFALAGPVLGTIASLGFLVYGLDQTQEIMNAGSSTLQFLPALPVSVLRLSTLGGTLVDSFFGGNGFVTLQDPATAIPLHPYAIAGFCGLMANAFDLIPMGNTDGGRMSLSIVGRQLNLILGGLTWIALAISSWTLPEQSASAITAVWLVNSLTQNDSEVPSRVESEQATLPRALAGLAAWFFAALVLIPMT